MDVAVDRAAVIDDCARTCHDTGADVLGLSGDLDYHGDGGLRLGFGAAGDEALVSELKVAAGADAIVGAADATGAGVGDFR